MEFGGRSQSVPSGVRNSWLGIHFTPNGHNKNASFKLQDQGIFQMMLLAMVFPLQDSSGLTEASRKTSDMPTGKGRGSQTAGMMPMTGPTGFWPGCSENGRSSA